MGNAAKRKKLIKKIKEKIADEYDEPKRRVVRPPLDQLVQSVLWRYTGVKSGVRAFRKFKNSFVDWNEMRVSTASEIASTISTAQWAYECAKHLHTILDNLFHLRNVVEMDFLDDFTQAQAVTFLRSLEGVNRDLTDEVLLFNYGANKFPLTKPGSRMCYRMGLIEKPSPTLKNQRALMEMWDQEYFIGFTLFLHDYGDPVCKAEKPKHHKCPVEELCPQIDVD